MVFLGFPLSTMTNSMKVIFVLLALSGCGSAQTSFVTPASSNGLSVTVDLPASCER